METLLKSLTEYYKNHHIAPGIQIAWLNDKQMFYGAIHVFPAGLGSRTILIKSLGNTIDDVVKKINDLWEASFNVPTTDADERTP